MATGDWYYLVWEHFGLKDRVREVGTYKLECEAQQVAGRLNANARFYYRKGHAPISVFFVQPVLEEHLREETAERFRRHLLEDRKRVLMDYNGTFKNLAKAMVDYTLYAVENCPFDMCVRLDDHGGRLECYCTNIEQYGDIKSYVLYSGREAVQLKVAIAFGQQVNFTTVEIFENEGALKDWLRNRPVAEAACEDRLIDLISDRHRVRNEWLK